MKSDNKLETRYRVRPAFQVWEEQSGTGPSPDSESEDTSPRPVTQAERAVMHPDRDDVEWGYWRGGWGRLTE
jgi:hypothetical protein